MKVSEILARNKKTLSNDVFPPKTSDSFEKVRVATENIAAIAPAYMSVTYGAGGGTSRYTLDIAKNIKSLYGVPTLAHLTCVSSTRETVLERIEDMKAAGIENVMALRGDIPEDMRDSDRSKWSYRYAVELVRELRESGADFCIGGACYPEVHPESATQKEDILFLKEKVDAGCDFLTTQMFFDNSKYFAFVERARAMGINIPIIPGIKPIHRMSQMNILPKTFRVDLPTELVTELLKCKDDAAVAQVGCEWGVHQCKELIEHGVPSLHFYTLNAFDSVYKIAKEIY